MTHLDANKLANAKVLVGNLNAFSNSPTVIWQPQRIALLGRLSQALRSHDEVRAFPELMAFAFWCRQSRLEKIATLLHSKETPQLAMGLGLVLHICPSNVPVNFLYSLAFSLLAGNTNVLRLSSKNEPLYEIAITQLNRILAEPEFSNMQAQLLVLQYGHDDEINAYLNQQADARIVWGGDETVQRFRHYPSKARAREIAFPDRYSLCGLDAESILGQTESELSKLANAIYNDIYIMNQAACSSPQLIAWVGLDATIQAAKARLWPQLENIAQEKFALEDIQVMNKYVDMCNTAISHPSLEQVEWDSPWLTRYQISHLTTQQSSFRGYFGALYEVSLTSLSELRDVIDERVQTLSYFGFCKAMLTSFVIDNQLRGIDRIVPVGQALEMDFVWDGYDIIKTLSRVITIR
ncbi:acyl-CoA reductase [Pseudoalteromonas fenneropenaei]|uniref:long-chain-fatty-acyl-CoA reductase n=1 Tax=Pseudoalteromonas fenneropenaei TaxID=1737459 RepID=A0ABV7CGV3_9GAMM